MDSNPQGAFGPRFWQAFRDTVTHIYDAVSLPDPSEGHASPSPPAPIHAPSDPDALSGTAFTMTRGPAVVARGGDQLLIILQLEGSVDTDYAGQRGRREAGDIAISDYARPFHSCGDRLRESDRSSLRARACLRRCWRSSRTALSFRAGAARRG